MIGWTRPASNELIVEWGHEVVLSKLCRSSSNDGLGRILSNVAVVTRTLTPIGLSKNTQDTDTWYFKYPAITQLYQSAGNTSTLTPHYSETVGNTLMRFITNCLHISI